MKRLEKELEAAKELEKHGLRVQSKESLYHWEVQMEGPKHSPYEGGVFVINMDFPEQYPFKFPEVMFKTPIWHPNIKEGMICKEMLGETDWKPNKKAVKILEAIMSMLIHPELETAINVEATMQCKLGTYFQIARDFTLKHAVPKK